MLGSASNVGITILTASIGTQPVDHSNFIRPSVVERSGTWADPGYPHNLTSYSNRSMLKRPELPDRVAERNQPPPF
jgi:hypothetical protein